MPLAGAEADAYRDRRGKARAAMSSSPNEIAAKILSGKMRIEDIDPETSTYYLFWVEDYVVQTGQGVIADRENEHLGRMDQGVFLLRQIWERELGKLVQGQPVKQWNTPAGLADMSAVEG